MGKLCLGWQIVEEYHFIGEPLWHEDQLPSWSQVPWKSLACVQRQAQKWKSKRSKCLPMKVRAPFIAQWTESWQLPVITDRPFRYAFYLQISSSNNCFYKQHKPHRTWMAANAYLMGHIWVSLLFPPSIPRLLLLLVLFSCALKKTVQWLCFEEQDRSPPSVSHRMISEPIFCLWERQQWATGWTCMWCLAVCDIVSGLCCAFLKMTKYFLSKMNILILDGGGEVLFTSQVQCLRNRSVTKWESCGAPQTSREPQYGKKKLSRSRLF